MVNGCKASLGVIVAVGEGVMEGVNVTGTDVWAAVETTAVELAGVDRQAERMSNTGSIKYRARLFIGLLYSYLTPHRIM